MYNHFVSIATFLDYLDFDKKLNINEQILKLNEITEDSSCMTFNWIKRCKDKKFCVGDCLSFELVNQLCGTSNIEELYIKNDDFSNVLDVESSIRNSNDKIVESIRVFEIQNNTEIQKAEVKIIGKSIDENTVGGVFQIAEFKDEVKLYQNIISKHVHDIKNQIMMMLSLANNIQNETTCKNVKKYAYSLKETLYSSNYMLSLINMDRGVNECNRLFNMHYVIKSILDSFGYEQTVVFTSELNAHNPRIYANKVLITNAVCNVLINAVQELSYQGRVKISTYNKNINPLSDYEWPQWLYIDIEDSGEGIAEDIMEKIFNPYFTTKPEGSGLGLYSSKLTLEQHNGTISVDSKKGEGAIFTICLPCHIE